MSAICRASGVPLLCSQIMHFRGLIGRSHPLRHKPMKRRTTFSWTDSIRWYSRAGGKAKHLPPQVIDRIQNVWSNRSMEVTAFFRPTAVPLQLAARTKKQKPPAHSAAGGFYGSPLPCRAAETSPQAGRVHDEAFNSRETPKPLADDRRCCACVPIVPSSHRFGETRGRTRSVEAGS
jgi:hypothetical protein